MKQRSIYFILVGTSWKRGLIRKGSCLKKAILERGAERRSRLEKYMEIAKVFEAQLMVIISVIYDDRYLG